MKKYLIAILLLISDSNCYSACHAYFSNVINSLTPPVVTFNDLSFDTLGGSVNSWSWDFGDGQTSNLQNPIHNYPANGNYLVCLIINTSNGCVDTGCYYVNAMPPTPTVHSILVPDSNAQIPCSAPAFIDFTYAGSFIAFAPPDSALIHVFFGDGLDSTFYRVIAPNITGTFTHEYQNAGSYFPTIIITAPTGVADTFASPEVFIAGSCGNITGKIFQDLNNNCIFDPGDIIWNNLPVYLNSNFNFVSSTNSDANGNYSFNVPTGQTYDVHVSPNFSSNLHVSCPVNGFYSINSFPSVGNDFVLACLPAFDLEVFLTANCLRPGFTDHVYISAFNNRCNTPSGQIEVIFPPDLTPLPDSVNSYTITGNVVTLPINYPDLFWQRNIPVLVSPTATIGTLECIDINATPVSRDAIPLNNSMTFCKQLTGAFDPNQKTVLPVGVGPQGQIDLGTELTYTIDFQNTGTADAVNIFILDTISSNLDLSSIRILGSSHGMNWSILPGRILRFTFNNIMLPDSNSNEFASHGYVSFKISQAPNLANQTVINNTAGIYFDFNSPVITNTTVNTIDFSLGIQDISSSSFTISPVPASQNCIVKFKDKGLKTIRITDYSGKLIDNFITSNIEYTIDLNKYENGIYLLSILNSENYISSKKLIVQN